eukprot:Gregarina_sp_Poly_1__3466@NODE_2004_length_2879_cov_11_464438_g1229_i1_p1_GENE_NODE_2004_length_2879_cov_11_464438_g1229_i1NODE_2004_length_2879_cov_11_464438_g1229_i1_p1_ORF_typecomplete_len448_score43_85Leg1/PF05612_12/0_36Leg1/PF05612_12/2_5e02DUF4441/PF14536_6/4_5e03DUF4441/PF14536_6/0_4DUF4441/PF14536_6/1_5e03_NODE_2004_length_2879_cov_11_464438_g1229_i112602603
MRRIMPKKNELVMNGQLWKCLIGCGCAIFLDHKNVVACESDDLRIPYSLFCYNLDAFCNKVFIEGYDDEALNGPLKVLPRVTDSDEYTYILEGSHRSCGCNDDDVKTRRIVNNFPRTKIPTSTTHRSDERILIAVLNSKFHYTLNRCPKALPKILKAWRQFMEGADIIQAKEQLENSKHFEMPHVGPRLPPDPEDYQWTSRGTKLFTSEESFFKHMAEKWTDQFFQLCKKRKKNFKGERILTEFEKLYSFQLGSGTMFSELLALLPNAGSYRKDFENFLNHFRAGTLSEFQETPLDLTAEAALNFITFCDDSLKKAIQIYRVSDCEAVIMRLIYMRITAILSLVNHDGLTNNCLQHPLKAKEFEDLEAKLKTIQKLSNVLSRDLRSTLEDELKHRSIVQEIVTLIRNFDPYKNCVHSSLQQYERLHFAVCHFKLYLSDASSRKSTNK